MHRTALPLCIPLLVGSLSAAERIQSPDAAWRTIPTAHYRIHHPDQPAFRAFAREVASKIEGIHALLEKEVGFALPGPTDVMVQNPEATANGMVMPEMGRPTVTLWIQSIPSDSEISHSGNFLDVLVLHELVHLHHLTLPNRNPTVLERLSSGPTMSRVTLKCPGWIIEGYATYLEGRLTGVGRPHGAYRAMVMRQLAREGMLPSYEDLSGVDRNLSSGIRYQGGSAFMEWLVTKHPKGHGLWPDLWKRLASRRYPTFQAGFKATFGDDPEVMYSRYRAELTHSALEMERNLSRAGLREGELWGQAPDGFIRNLSVSPDGSTLLAQATAKEMKRFGLQVYPLGEDGKKAKEAREAKEKLAKKDKDLPEEAPELRRERTPEQTLLLDGDSVAQKPIWEADGSVRYEVTRHDAEGVGYKSTGTWKPRGVKAGTPVIQHVHPNYRPEGWVITLGGKSLRLPFEPYGALAHDTLRKVVYAATPVDGIFNLVRVPFDGQSFGPMEVLTRTAAGAFYPAPTPDGKQVYFAQASGHGSQIRRLDLSQGPVPAAPVAMETNPFVKETVLSRPDEPSKMSAPVEPPADKAYAVRDSHVGGERFGLLFDPSNAAYQLGAGGSDVLGRLNWTALGSIAFPGTHARGPRGGQLGFAYRGWAWAPSVHLFTSLTRPSVQRFEPVQGWDRERKGGEFRLTREWWPSQLEGRLSASAAQERVAPLDRTGKTVDRTVSDLTLMQKAAWSRHLTVLSANANVTAQAGRTDGQSWRLTRGDLTLTGSYDGMGLIFQYSSGRVSGDPTAADRFSLGGQATGLLPRSLEANVVFQPALPTFSALGDRFERWRASLDGGLWMEGTRVWNSKDQTPAYLRIVGLDLMSAVETLAPSTREILQRYLGRMEARMTLQVPLDGPMKHRTVFTLGLIHRF